MKVRSGFVSNSSSSSFVIIGVRKTMEELDKMNWEDKNIFMVTPYYGYEGELCGFVTLKEFLQLKASEADFSDCDFYDVIKYASEDTTELKKEDLKDGVEYEVFGGERDHWFSVEEIIKEAIGE